MGRRWSRVQRGGTFSVCDAASGIATEDKLGEMLCSRHGLMCNPIRGKRRKGI
jgi:hypothetical protein